MTRMTTEEMKIMNDLIENIYEKASDLENGRGAYKAGESRAYVDGQAEGLRSAISTIRAYFDAKGA